MKNQREEPEYTGIRKIGIPRALHYYRYGQLWTDFFQGLGLECVISRPTDREILTEGVKLAIDESCYPAKAYLGHVQALVGKCDAVFVPRIAGKAVHDNFCTRFESLYDLVNNTFEGSGARFVTMSSDFRDDTVGEKAYVNLGASLGFSREESRKAYQDACRNSERLALELQAEMKAQLQEPGIKLLLAAHAYVARDPYIGGQIEKMLTDLGCIVLHMDGVDLEAAVVRSQDLCRTMPWTESREILGAIDMLKDEIDGVVIASAYPCGPDSLADEFIIRTVKDLPILRVTVDVQDGSAGLETRLESFVDIIRFREENRYVGN